MNGKGDKIRPSQISREQWEKNWESIFGKKRNLKKKKKGNKNDSNSTK